MKTIAPPYRALWRALCTALLLVVVISPRQAHAQSTPDPEGLAQHLVTTARATAMNANTAVRADRGDGQPIASVEVVCDLPTCTRRRVEALRRLTGLHEGDIADPNALLLARDALGDTRAFASVRLDRRVDAEGLHLTFDTEGATLIRRVQVRAGLWLSGEVRRRIFLRSGEPWLADLTEMQRQEQALVDFYERDGLFGTLVDIRAQQVAPYTVDLRFRITRGRRLRVRNIYVRGQAVLSYQEISAQLLGQFSVLRGFTQKDFQDATEAVIERYRELGYIQARYASRVAHPNADGETVSLFLELREGPLWDIAFVGNDRFNAAQLLRAMTFYQTGFIDDEEIDNAVGELRSTYATVGYYFTDIEVIHQERTDGSHALTFVIDEGEPAEIRAIAFEGNQALSDQALTERMETSPYGLLGGGVLQRSMLAKDVADILSAYQELGYMRARVPRVAVVGENGGRDLYITVFIEEGQPTRVSSIRFEGNAHLDDETLRETISVHAGDLLRFDALRADVASIAERYYTDGFADVRPTLGCTLADGSPTTCSAPRTPETCRLSLEGPASSCERVLRGRALVEECQLVRMAPECAPTGGVTTDLVGIVYQLDEGAQSVFGDVFVHGNFRTRDRAIIRELPFERGTDEAPHYFDHRLLLQGQRNLRSLGVFDSVRIETIDVPGTTPVERAVLVQVAEDSAQYLEHRVGLGVESSVTNADNVRLIFGNQTTYRNINFLGLAEELQVIGRLNLDAQNPQGLGDQIYEGLAQTTYADRRFHAWGALSDPWEMRTDLAYHHDQLEFPPFPQTRSLSLSNLIREESDSVRGLFFGFGAQVERVDACEQSDIDVAADCTSDAEFDPALILSITPQLTLDRRDNPLNPSRGTYWEFALSIADDVFAFVRSESFTKATARVSTYNPLGHDFLLALNAHAGVAVGGILHGFRSDEALVLPTSDQFRLGGSTSVRGFRDGSIAAVATRRFGGDAVLQANAELRYPLLPSVGVYGAMFVDAGQLAEDPEDLRLDAFHTSTGIGLRWIAADLIPVAFDYGAPLNRQAGERIGRLHFNVGYTF